MMHHRHVRFIRAAHQPQRRRISPSLLRRGRGERGRGEKQTVPSLPRITVQTTVLLTLAFVGSLAALLVVGLSTYMQITSSLTPRLKQLQGREFFETSRIYDRHGTLLYEFFDSGKRTWVPYEDISGLVKNATVAIEDKTFFTNTGVDYEGIMRALYQNISSGEEMSGASTITQQVVKNVILTEEELQYEKRYERKFKEIILAQELNERYSKEEILELYLNEVYYGNLAYGIEAASQVYFGKSASGLNLTEASLLGGLPQLPSRYEPINYLRQDEEGGYLPGVHLGRRWMSEEYQLPDDVPPAKWRQVMVLRRMVEDGYVSEADARRAAMQDLRFAPQEVPINAPHFVFYVRKLLEERLGKKMVEEGGLEIHTTLDLDIQRMAQQKAAEHIKNLEYRNIHNAAVVVMQPLTGEVLAMVGSIDYNAIKPNQHTRRRRQCA